MRRAIATLLSLWACAEPEQVRWPAPDPEAPNDLLLRRLPDDEVELTRFEPAPQFTWALTDEAEWLLLRFDSELDRVLLEQDGPRIRLGDVALPSAKRLFRYERSTGLQPVEALPEWAQGLGVTPRCPSLEGQRISLPSGMRTSFAGPPGVAYVAYQGGVAEFSLGGAPPRLFPQAVDVMVGAWSEGRLWVGLTDGRLAALDPATGALGASSPTSVTLPVSGLAAAPDGTVVAVDGALVTWWSQGGGPFERGPTLELPAPQDRCISKQVLLSWWPARSAFVATYRASLRPATAPQALWTVSRTEARAERLSLDLGAINGLFPDDRGEPVLLGQSTGLDALNPQARVVIRFDPGTGEWRAERPLGVPFHDALGALGFVAGFLYVGQEGLIAAFRDYGGTCSPEPVLGGGDYDGLVPLDEHHALASGCGQDAVYLVERR